MFKKKQRIPQLTREKSLGAIPVRNAHLQWNKSEKGEISIDIPLKKSRWTSLLSKIFSAPKKRTLVLDEIGAKTWMLCDGKNSVEGIIKILCRDLHLNRKEVETSLLQYLKQLGSRGLIGLAVENKQAADKKNNK